MAVWGSPVVMAGSFHFLRFQVPLFKGIHWKNLEISSSFALTQAALTAFKTSRRSAPPCPPELSRCLVYRAVHTPHQPPNACLVIRRSVTARPWV